MIKIQHYKFWHESSTLQVQHTKVNPGVQPKNSSYFKKKFNMIRLTCKFNIKIQHDWNSQRPPKESAQIDFGLKRAYENSENSS